MDTGKKDQAAASEAVPEAKPDIPPEADVPRTDTDESTKVGAARIYEDLPEVVQPDASPEAVSPYQADHSRRMEEGYIKYPAADYTEHDSTAQYPEAVYQEVEHPKEHELSDVEHDDSTEAEEEMQRKPAVPMILGLKRRTFMIIVVVLVLVIGAAVGGGVGGSMAMQSSNEETSNEPSGTSTTPSATPTPSEAFLNNATGAGNDFGFQAFAAAGYNGEHTSILRGRGGSDIPFEVVSYAWDPADTSCCVTFCINETLRVGWTCEESFTEEAMETFGEIWVWCGEARDEEGTNAVCSVGNGPTEHT